MGYRIRYELRRRGGSVWRIILAGVALVLALRLADFEVLARYVGGCIRACGG